jgi:transcriptional regulator with XRE-family HTH domain
MYATHLLFPMLHTLRAHDGSGLCALESLIGLLQVIGALAAAPDDSQSTSSISSRLRITADRIYRRMRLVGLNQTQLAERCSLAAIHLFEDAEVPSLTRDRISKILMNRQDVSAKSAARIITHAELTVIANVLKVSVEWLIGQDGNRDPVVWNVLANPDRVTEFAHVIQAYEEAGKEIKIWSRFPMHACCSEAFSHALNQRHYGTKPGVANPRSLVEFYNRVARVRRKWILRPGRPFQYTSLLYRSHFEEAIGGQGVFSTISKTILGRNLDTLIDTLTNPLLRIKLVIIKDEYTKALDGLRDYEILQTVDNSFSSWNYHNGDVGWSEHPSYTHPQRKLLNGMEKHSLFRNVDETVEYVRSLRSRLRDRK